MVSATSESKIDCPRIDWTTLIAAAQQGDPSAMERLWREVRSHLRKLAVDGLGAGLRSKLDASDIVQQSLLDLQFDLTSFQGKTEAELRAWLFRLVRNNVLDQGRRYRQTQSRNVAREVSLEHDGRTRDVAGDELTASTISEHREADRQLTRAISRLPDRRQALLKLRHQQGLSFARIAIKMGLTEVGARQLWVRTVDELRHYLESSDDHRSQKPR